MDHRCNQCGECCTSLENGIYKDCRFLVRYLRSNNAKPSRCLIYQHRLYAITGDRQFCFYRDRMKYNFPNCPFNKDGQEMHPKFINTKKDINSKVGLWRDLNEGENADPEDLMPE